MSELPSDEENNAWENGSVAASSDNGQSEEPGPATTEKVLAKNETTTVRRLKIMLLLLLGLLAIGVALVVNFYVRNSEVAVFEASFQGDAVKVLATLGANLDSTLQSADTFVTNIMSYAKNTDQEWPFVTIPDFAVRGGKVLSESNAYVLNFYPWVENDQRAEWENYTAHNNQWQYDAIEIQANTHHFTGPIIRNGSNFDVIHSYDEFDLPEEEQGLVGVDYEGPYMPWWQCYPVINYYPVYNWDLFSAPGFDASLDAVLETHKALITEAYMIPTPEDDQETIEYLEGEADWLQDYLEEGAEPMEPISDIYYPLLEESLEYFDIFADSDYLTQPKSNETFKGLFAISIYWRDLLKDILPDGSDGIVVVVDNPCNPTFTYQINGPRTIYLGGMDAHDAQYDSLVQESDFLDLRKFAVTDSGYSGLPLNENFCQFRLRIYPSDEMKAQYITSDNVIFAISAALIFVFTTTVFLLYDYCVERRQRLVMHSAKKSSAIVNTLFPEAVRDRMYDENSTQMKEQKPDPWKMGFQQTEEEVAKSSRPIAELYPEATVFFADIAGFTKWSSSRTPSEVFVLLETLYGAFDKIAESRKVFKIETIGDCYVAVVGLPYPKKNHAVVMARFAADCLRELNQVVNDLEHELGEGTSDLRLRVGLHSGAVTAGVLRGQKARFQLFGDTVNTASRMESNGLPSMIHVSEATANELMKLNKGSWLTERPGGVEAKGKGNMRTFWVNPQSTAGSVSSGIFSMSHVSTPISNFAGNKFSSKPVSATPSIDESDEPHSDDDADIEKRPTLEAWKGSRSKTQVEC